MKPSVAYFETRGFNFQVITYLDKTTGNVFQKIKLGDIYEQGLPTASLKLNMENANHRQIAENLGLKLTSKGTVYVHLNHEERSALSAAQKESKRRFQ